MNEGSRLRRIEEILNAALHLREAERDGYVAAACGGDEDLRREVESLLSVHEEASDWFEGFSRDLLALRMDEIDAALGEKRRIGPWETLERIGRGGMGSVYRAERADGQYEQQVALKLVRRGMESEEAVRRFLAEREILAGLDHPNIARLVDGGVTDDGLPWFAMEMVQGERIDEFSTSRGLSVRQQLDLFLQVTDAVAYLHRHLVIHRDLKPANVLVTDEGSVKIVDFGIAKILESDDAGLTRTGSRPRTPRYAAPEQIEGGSVTTATDVYALGVLLYELLSGSPVFDEEGRALEEAILETDPGLPSVSAPPEVRRVLRGDLDTIVLMAIRKEPERRYGSAEAMGEDVRRFLAGRPVAARPSSPGYRAAKFVRRHGFGVAVTAALLVLLVSFGVFASLQSARLARERDRAREVSDLLVDVFSAPDPTVSPGETVTARELVDRGVGRVRRGLEERPLLQADLLMVLGRTYRNLALFDEAVSLYREVLEVRSRILPEGHVDRASALYALGEVLIETADYDEARSHLETALEIRETVLGPGALLVAKTLNDLARIHDHEGRVEDALRLHRRALRIRRGRGDEVELSQTLHNLAGVLLDLDRHDEAIRMLREAVEIREAAFGDLHPRTLASRNSLAVGLERSGRFEEAGTVYQKVLEARRRLHPEGHPEVAVVLANLANLLLRTEGNEAEAAAMHREALETERRVRGEEHPMVGQRYHTLARAVHAQGRLEEAEGLFRRAWEILVAALPEGHVNLAYPMTELGQVLTEQGRAREAEPILREALDLRIRGFPEGHVRIAEARSALGAALTELGRRQEAEKLLVSALEVLRDDPGAGGLASLTAARLEASRSGREDGGSG